MACIWPTSTGCRSSAAPSVQQLIVMALAVVGVWMGNFAPPRAGRQKPRAQDAGLETLLVLGWVEIIAAAAVVLGLAVGLWFHRPLWAPGVLFVVLGMALHWGWWLLDRKVDMFGTVRLQRPRPRAVPHGQPCGCG